MESSKSRHERSVEMRDRDDSSVRERWEDDNDNLEENGSEKKRDSGKHRSKDRSKSSRREEKERKSRDHEDSMKDPVPSRDRRAEDRDDHERDKGREKAREKDADREKSRGKERESDKERKDRGRKKEHERVRDTEKDSEREHEKERGKEKSKDRGKDGEKSRENAKDRGKEKDRDRHKDGEKEKDNDRDSRSTHEREKGKVKTREERETELKKERSAERERGSSKQWDEPEHKRKDMRKDETSKLDREDGRYRDMSKQGLGSHFENDGNRTLEQEDDEGEASGSRQSALELKERIIKMKEERLKKKPEGSSEILSWVSKSRKLEEKRNAEKEKALQLSRIFEEQDNIQGDSEDESAQHTAEDLAGFKILHGLDKVVEGGAVVLTLKDQSILADGDINQEVDMLENIEIGEQKRRTEAYSAAKKKAGTYVDKFNDEPGSEKKMLPQYDDPSVDEGVTLDAKGHFSGEAEKKLEELRRRIDGASTKNQFEDLNASATISSDYYTHEEMLKFKKPKKKKSLRKKDKLDLDALEAEAIASGLGAGDLGSRNDRKRQALKEEQERSEAEKRSNAYQSAYAKADEASKALRQEKNLTAPMEEDDTPAFGDDDDDLRKSLERARKLALRKQEEGAATGPQAIALLASYTGNNMTGDNEKPTSGESQDNKVVFTEMEEFVWGLQLDEESHKPDGEDVFMEEDVAPRAPSQEPKEDDGGWAELKDTSMDETSADQGKEEVVPDETIHEVAVGKGLSGALHLLKERGTLKETVEWGGRNMDKKKSKLVGIYENDGQKEIRIERTDEYGRILTPKEAFRLLSHKFHGKGPGKMKQEKRMRQYQEELKVKQMKNADTPSLSVERMRDAQAQLKTPYLVLSGNVRPGQTSDPRSGFATVEKDFPGGLTPMLGDRKVEHFLGIKRKPEGGDMGPPKKPKS